jgi:cobalt/nickel transport system permease protein
VFSKNVLIDILSENKGIKNRVLREEDRMHIPDSFVPLTQAIVYWVIALPFVVMSMKWAKNELDEMKVPVLAALAAGIFAIQAMNIPIGMGTSGHMVGAVLVAIVFGSPWAGVLVLTLVLLVQGFAFGDGGITTMGANILKNVLTGMFIIKKRGR